MSEGGDTRVRFVASSVFVCLLSLAWNAPVRAAALDVYTLSSKSNIDFRTAKTDQKIASFLILNPGLGNFTAYIKFANDCNVQHIYESNLLIPLQGVRLAINGVNEAAPLWSRGTNCTSVLTYTPPVGVYAATYQMDVLVSWNASQMNLAGRYSESISVTAITIP